MSIAGKKDKLAAGGRTMVIAGGIGESPLMQKIAEAESAGVVEVREEAVPAFHRPQVKSRRFNPNPGVYMVRQAVDTTVSYSGIESALASGEDKAKLLLVQEDANKEQPAEGYIIEAGSGCIHPKGSYIAFGKYAGTQFKLNGEVLLFMRDEDIFGTITDPSTELIEEEFEVTPGSVIATA